MSNLHKLYAHESTRPHRAFLQGAMSVKWVVDGVKVLFLCEARSTEMPSTYRPPPGIRVVNLVIACYALDLISGEIKLELDTNIRVNVPRKNGGHQKRIPLAQRVSTEDVLAKTACSSPELAQIRDRVAQNGRVVAVTELTYRLLAPVFGTQNMFTLASWLQPRLKHLGPGIYDNCELTLQEIRRAVDPDSSSGRGLPMPARAVRDVAEFTRGIFCCINAS